MAEQTINSEHVVPPEPELRRREHQPQGVLRKNLKPDLSRGNSAGCDCSTLQRVEQEDAFSMAAARHEPPQPTVQDNTDNNVQDLKNQLAAERQKEAQTAARADAERCAGERHSAQQAAAAAYGPNGQAGLCTPGQPCSQQQTPAAVSPEHQQAQQLAAKERELAYDSRFASNLVYTRSTDAPLNPVLM